MGSKSSKKQKDEELKNKEEKEDIKGMKKSKDKQKEKSIEEITQTEIDIKEKSKKPINWNKMYGPEFEYIKEYKPIESKDNVIENILDNNIEELIDIKYNKPIIKSEEKVEEEKTKIKKKNKFR